MLTATSDLTSVAMTNKKSRTPVRVEGSVATATDRNNQRVQGGRKGGRKGGRRIKEKGGGE